MTPNIARNYIDSRIMHHRKVLEQNPLTTHPTSRDVALQCIAELQQLRIVLFGEPLQPRLGEFILSPTEDNSKYEVH